MHIYNSPASTVTSEQEYWAFEFKTSYDTVVVSVRSYRTGTLSITANGTYDVSSYASAYVNVATIDGLTWTSLSSYEGQSTYTFTSDYDYVLALCSAENLQATMTYTGNGTILASTHHSSTGAGSAYAKLIKGVSSGDTIYTLWACHILGAK